MSTFNIVRRILSTCCCRAAGSHLAIPQPSTSPNTATTVVKVMVMMMKMAMMRSMMMVVVVQDIESWEKCVVWAHTPWWNSLFASVNHQSGNLSS